MNDRDNQFQAPRFDKERQELKLLKDAGQLDDTGVGSFIQIVAYRHPHAAVAIAMKFGGCMGPSLTSKVLVWCHSLHLWWKAVNCFALSPNGRGFLSGQHDRHVFCASLFGVSFWISHCW